MPQQVACVQQKGNTDKNMYATHIDMGIELVPGQQQQVILQTDQQGPFEITVAKYRSFSGMGAIQIALGVACILFLVIMLFNETDTLPPFIDFIVTVPGIWIIFTGLIGVRINRQSKGWIIAFMVMSIISTALFWILVLFLTFGVLISNDPDGTGETKAILFIICGIVELVIAIVSAAICCRALCCNTAGYVRFDAPGAPPGPYQAKAAPPYESILLSVPETKQAVEQNLGYQPNTPPPEYSAGQPEHI